MIQSDLNLPGNGKIFSPLGASQYKKHHTPQFEFFSSLGILSEATKPTRFFAEFLSHIVGNFQISKICSIYPLCASYGGNNHAAILPLYRHK